MSYSAAGELNVGNLIRDFSAAIVSLPVVFVLIIGLVVPIFEDEFTVLVGSGVLLHELLFSALRALADDLIKGACGDESLGLIANEEVRIIRHVVVACLNLHVIYQPLSAELLLLLE